MKEHLFPVFLDQNFVYTPAEVITFLDLLISRQKPYGFLAIGYHNFPYEYVKEHAKDLENFVFFFYNNIYPNTWSKTIHNNFSRIAFAVYGIHFGNFFYIYKGS